MYMFSRLMRPLMFLLLLGYGSLVRSETPLPAPPQLSANSFLLIDHVSGKVLAAKEPDQNHDRLSGCC